MILLLTPGTVMAQGAGGGTSFFRAFEEVCSMVDEVVSASPLDSSRAGSAIRRRRVRVTSCDETMALVQREKPDLVIKASGMLAGDEDRALDLSLAGEHYRARTKVIYVDVDAASRLPILSYQPYTYLGDVAAAGVPLVVVGGGARALHQYRSLGFERSVEISTCLAYLGVKAVQGCGDCMCTQPDTERPIDLCSLIDCSDPRSEREQTFLTLLKSKGWRTDQSGQRGRCSPAEWRSTLRQSLVCLNLLRGDVQGYADVASARIFEAVHAGALVMSDTFPGLDGLVPEPFRAPSLPEALDGLKDTWARDLDALQLNHRLMSRLAYDWMEINSEWAQQDLRNALGFET